jgi:hypothetical protein
MNDSCLDVLVAQATGESVFEISRRGFHDAMPVVVAFDPEPMAPAFGRLEAGVLSGGAIDAASNLVSDLTSDVVSDLVDFGEHGIDWEEVLAGSRRAPRRNSRRQTARSSGGGR